MLGRDTRDTATQESARSASRNLRPLPRGPEGGLPERGMLLPRSGSDGLQLCIAMGAFQMSCTMLRGTSCPAQHGYNPLLSYAPDWQTATKSHLIVSPQSARGRLARLGRANRVQCRSNSVRPGDLAELSRGRTSGAGQLMDMCSTARTNSTSFALANRIRVFGADSGSRSFGLTPAMTRSAEAD